MVDLPPRYLWNCGSLVYPVRHFVSNWVVVTHGPLLPGRMEVVSVLACSPCGGRVDNIVVDRSSRRHPPYDSRLIEHDFVLDSKTGVYAA